MNYYIRKLFLHCRMNRIVKIIKLRLLMIAVLILISVVFSACRDYVNVNPTIQGTQRTLIYQFDSLGIEESAPGSYFIQNYYQNNNSIMDSIQVEFTGETNIDSNNSCNLTLQLDNLSNNTTIRTYTILNPDSVNHSNSFGFRITNVYSFILYFNVTMVINSGQQGNSYLRIKNIKVYNVY